MLKLIGKTEFLSGIFSEFNHNTFKEFYRNYIDDAIWEIPSFEEEINHVGNIKTNDLKFIEENMDTIDYLIKRFQISLNFPNN